MTLTDLFFLYLREMLAAIIAAVGYLYIVFTW